MMRLIVIILVVQIFNFSCVSIPKEAVTLSEVIGERITAIQIAHENLIIDYFQKSRDAIDLFLQERWIPEFLETFVKDANVMEELNQPNVLSDEDETKIMEALNEEESFTAVQLINIIRAVNSGLGDAERGAIILDFSKAALGQINLQRMSMVNVIDEREKVVLKEIRANYMELLNLQSTLTAHVRSAHDVVESQDEILSKIGLLDQRDQILKDAIEANETVSKVLKEGGSAKDLAKKFLESKN